MFRCLMLTLACLIAEVGLADSTRPNVLFIAVDDLRPELSCYGATRMQTPHIDRLASQGVLFTRAYCMVPTCGASRASLMTGLRPARHRFVNYLTWAEKDAASTTTMNTHFKTNGYRTISLGKVFHHPTDNAHGWSVPAWRPSGGPTYKQPENQQLAERRQKEKGSRGRGPAYESAPHPDDEYRDGQIALKAIETLGDLSRQDQLFFLAVGFLKPHLPFVCPQKYWEQYPVDTIRLPATYHRPEDAPDEAIHSFGELRSYSGIPATGPVSNETALNLIRGYSACVSFVDAQIGRVLDELDRLDLSENTIVVLWGDHGWNLGEHTLWCKHCCFETSMRIPIIIRAPGITGGQRTTSLTETIDLYPTLCELAGLAGPDHLQGQSLVPILHDPSLSLKSYAIGRFRNGDTIRTDEYRFTEYTDNQDRQTARMLYNHASDPAEDHNIAEHAEIATTVTDLNDQLRERKGTDVLP